MDQLAGSCAASPTPRVGVVAAGYPSGMATITIHDVPDDVRDELALRAARAGRSLQDYLVAELCSMAARPDTLDPVFAVRSRVKATGRVLNTNRIVTDLNRERQ